MGDHNAQKMMTSNETPLIVAIDDLVISEGLCFNLSQKPRLNCSFLLLIIIYEYYKAQSAISLESDERIVFTPFLGSQTRNIRSTQFSQSNSFFLALSNDYINDC